MKNVMSMRELFCPDPQAVSTFHSKGTVSRYFVCTKLFLDGMSPPGGGGGGGTAICGLYRYVPL